MTGSKSSRYKQISQNNVTKSYGESKSRGLRNDIASFLILDENRTHLTKQMFKGQYYPKTFVVDDRRDENAIIKTTYEWNVKSFDIAGLVKDTIALPDSEYVKTSTAE